MTGNKYAEKWTREAALQLIHSVWSHIADNPDELHLGYSIISVGYYPELWSYLSKKFRDDDQVFQAIKRVEITLEARIVNNTFNGKLKSAAMAIFYLKNKHGYIDHASVESNVKIGAEAQGVQVVYVDREGQVKRIR